MFSSSHVLLKWKKMFLVSLQSVLEARVVLQSFQAGTSSPVCYKCCPAQQMVGVKDG